MIKAWLGQSAIRWAVLRTLSQGSRKPATLTELAQASGFPRRSVHHVLTNLLEHGLIGRSQSANRHLYQWNDEHPHAKEVEACLAKPREVAPAARKTRSRARRGETRVRNLAAELSSVKAELATARDRIRELEKRARLTGEVSEMACSRCGQRFGVHARSAGKLVKCPKCGRLNKIPDFGA